MENRFLLLRPYFNSSKSNTVVLEPNNSVSIYFNTITNIFFEVYTNTGSGAYWRFLKLGFYRLILHVSCASVTGNKLRLELKNSDNTTLYRQSKSDDCMPFELVIKVISTSQYYLLKFTNEDSVNRTVYVDDRYTWLEIEYLGQ